MTLTKSKKPLAEATALALEVLELLGPFYVKAEIAGSIRRLKPEVGDIEIVLIPKYEPDPADMFGDKQRNIYFPEAQRLRESDVFNDRLDATGRPAFGERFQRVLYKDFALDLFCVLPPAQWGVIFAIRTGPADFSHQLATQKRFGGHMPDGWRIEGGQLWNASNEVVRTETEEEFFNAIGLNYIVPEDRI